MLNAPVEQVWKAWTEPSELVHWWGPNGFTTTIHTMEVAVGKEWTLILHAPDGTNYPNRSIFTEVAPVQKIAFEHFNPHFFTTVLLEARGGQTQLTWIMEFDTAEMRDTVVKAHKAEEGLKQNVEKLSNYLLARL